MGSDDLTTGGLHLLDVLQKTCVYGPMPEAPGMHLNEYVLAWDAGGAWDAGDLWPATDLSEAGIRFRKSSTNSFTDIHFKDGVLSVPALNVDRYAITVIHNFMAFEQQHVGTGSDVTAYVYFIKSMIHSAKDVRLLHSEGIILRSLTDEGVVKAFSTAATANSISGFSNVGWALWQIAQHRRRMWPRWRFRIVHTYFSIPGKGYSLVAAVVVLGLTVAQVVYGALQYYQAKTTH